MIEQELELNVDCVMCGTHASVLVQENDLRNYASGELVQRVWPDASIDFREVVIGWRTKMYVCGECGNFDE